MTAFLLAAAALVAGCRTGTPPAAEAPPRAGEHANEALTEASADPASVVQLRFSRESDLLAVVTRSGDGRPAEYAIWVLGADLRSRADAPLATISAPGVAWAPGQRLWCVRRHGGRGHLDCLDPRTGASAGQASPALDGTPIGPVSASETAACVAVLAEGNRGAQRLVVWRPERSQVTEVPLPQGFRAAQLPPVASPGGEYVAVVTAGCEQFLAFDLRASVWLRPASNAAACAWGWERVADEGPERRRESLWLSGENLRGAADRFLVDAEGLHLWVARPMMPLGATMGSAGQPEGVPPDAELLPLDLDARAAVADRRGGDLSALVWQDSVVSVSAAAGLRKAAVLYGREGTAGTTMADCVGYVRRGASLAEDVVFADDGSAMGEVGVSYAPDGRRLAMVQSQEGGRRLVVLSAKDGRVLASAPLPQRADGTAGEE